MILMIELLLITFLNHATIQAEVLLPNREPILREYVVPMKTILYSPLDVNVRKEVRIYGRASKLILNPYKGRKDPPKCRSPA